MASNEERQQQQHPVADAGADDVVLSPRTVEANRRQSVMEIRMQVLDSVPLDASVTEVDYDHDDYGQQGFVASSPTAAEDGAVDDVDPKEEERRARRLQVQQQQDEEAKAVVNIRNSVLESVTFRLDEDDSGGSGADDVVNEKRAMVLREHVVAGSKAGEEEDSPVVEEDDDGDDLIAAKQNVLGQEDLLATLDIRTDTAGAVAAAAVPAAPGSDDESSVADKLPLQRQIEVQRPGSEATGIVRAPGQYPGAYRVSSNRNGAIQADHFDSMSSIPRSDEGDATANRRHAEAGGTTAAAGTDVDENGAPRAQIVDIEDMEAEFMNRVIANAATATAVVIPEGGDEEQGEDQEQARVGGRKGSNAETPATRSRFGIILFYSVICLLLALIVVVVIIVAGGSSNNGGNNGESRTPGRGDGSPTAPPEPTSSPAPSRFTTDEYLLELLTPISGLDKLQDVTTPQYRAMNWILYEDPASYDIRTTDQQALIERYIAVTFYFATTIQGKGGVDWYFTLNFLSEFSICDWNNRGGRKGIFCHIDSPYVMRFDFFENNLHGTIPSEVFSLRLLQDFNLFKEPNLVGTIPKELGSNELPLLEGIRVSHSGVTGTITEFTSSTLVHTAKWVNFERSRFTGTVPWSTMIPQEEPFDTEMLVLVVSGNNVTGTLPSDIGRLTALENLAIGTSMISGTIPPSIGGCDNLKQIWCYGASLTGTIPTELGRMSRLGLFECPYNLLTGTLPTEFGFFFAFVHFELSSNLLTGTIPTELRTIRFNHMNDQFGGRDGKIHLRENALTGTIPYLGQLANFDLSSNQLTGTFPSEYSTWEPNQNEDIVIDISGNNVTGSLDDVLCDRYDTLGQSATITVDCDTVTCSCCLCKGETQ